MMAITVICVTCISLHEVVVFGPLWYRSGQQLPPTRFILRSFTLQTPESELKCCSRLLTDDNRDLGTHAQPYASEGSRSTSTVLPRGAKVFAQVV